MYGGGGDWIEGRSGDGEGKGKGSQRSASYLEMKCKEKKITKTKFLTFLFLNSWNCNTLKRGLCFVCIHMHFRCVPMYVCVCVYESGPGLGGHADKRTAVLSRATSERRHRHRPFNIFLFLIDFETFK